MENYIKLINQQLLQLCALIPKFKNYSTETENRLAYKIICWKIKRIEAIKFLIRNLASWEHSSSFIKLNVQHMNICLLIKLLILMFK